jgi:hypothetical protein
MGEFSKAWDSSKSFRILVVSGIALVIVLMIAAGQNDSTPTPPAPVVANPNAPDPYADTAENHAHYAATIDQSMLDAGIESSTINRPGCCEHSVKETRLQRTSLAGLQEGRVDQRIRW